MQKTIRIMALIATALTMFSLFLLIVSIPFQQWIAKTIYMTSPDVLGTFPYFPWVEFLMGILKAGCLAVLIICCGNKRGGIWLEVLMLVVLLAIIPGIQEFVLVFVTSFYGRAMGMAYMAGYSVASKIFAACMIPANLGIALAYVTCGMSIAFKKKGEKEV